MTITDEWAVMDDDHKLEESSRNDFGCNYFTWIESRISLGRCEWHPSNVFSFLNSLVLLLTGWYYCCLISNITIVSILSTSKLTFHSQHLKDDKQLLIITSFITLSFSGVWVTTTISLGEQYQLEACHFTIFIKSPSPLYTSAKTIMFHLILTKIFLHIPNENLLDKFLLLGREGLF